MKHIPDQDSFLFEPKYRKAAEQLRNEIALDRWGPGDQLPIERELAASLSVSVNTLRRAVSQLVSEGVLLRRQGAGTFVRSQDPAVDHPAPATAASSGSRLLIGVLVPSTTYYYPQVIDGVQRHLRETGSGVMLASSKYDTELEEEELRAMLETGVHGLLLVPNLHLMDDPQAYVDRLGELPVPHVLVERRPPDPAPDDPTSYVMTDHEGGVYRAVKHLRALGHRSVGLMGRHHTGTSEIIARGFAESSRLLDVEVPEGAAVRHESWSSAQVAEYARHCSRTGVSAVFCHGDRDAAALTVHARRIGMDVPRDLAVVAYDDEVAEVGDVPLTAVSPPKQEVGHLAAELLLRNLNQGDRALTHRIRLQPRLVTRASCGARSVSTARSSEVPA
jgi:DNA-binding LacI/PurR family transcriptional regulator